MHDRDDKSGAFRTFIPEDVKRSLNHYISVARLVKGDIALSFHDKVDVLDVKVQLAYLAALVHVGEIYWKAVNSKIWTTSSASMKEKGVEAVNEELVESAEWMCSVANDTHRCVAEGIANPSEDITWNREYIFDHTNTLVV